ncbi:hypothetical protein ILP97_37525 [Amycolatopsis sp. H6(2020)]|nr:hypothetical protein [Amycolatopsis sp. H6(2020)]
MMSPPLLTAVADHNRRDSTLGDTADGRIFLRWAPTAFDIRIFASPYILIDQHNRSVFTARVLDDALDELADNPSATTIVGTLRPPLLGIDVDTTDNEPTSEACLAFTDDLIAWSEKYGLPWLRRNSGRPGHFHLIVKVPSTLHHTLRDITAKLGRWHRVSPTVRSTLRLTSAPHRNGTTAAAFEGTLNAHDVVPADRSPATRARRGAGLQCRRPDSRRSRRIASRSEREYGNALAMARAGWSSGEAWQAARRPGTKAAEIGNRAWRRWFWAPAVTIADAESRRTEQEAWSNFQLASPTQAQHIGRRRWHDERWIPALHEATIDRPRRRREPGRSLSPSGEPSANVPARLDALRKAFFNAVHDKVGKLRTLHRPVRPASLYAALHALAAVIVHRHGSLSVRDWAERARLDSKTVRRARDAAHQLGLIRRTHCYKGGIDDCDTWLPTDVIDQLARDHAAKSPTVLYTPSIHAIGSADLNRLRRAHVAERRAWRAFVKRDNQRIQPNVQRPPRRAPAPGGPMPPKIPNPRLELSGAEWDPELYEANSIAVIPSMHIPFHSKQLIGQMLAAISHQRPDLVIQTGPMFARDTLAGRRWSAPLSPEEHDLARRGFLEPLAQWHQGPLLINGRRVALSLENRLDTPTDGFADHPPVPTITKLSGELCIADNIEINSPYAWIPGNHALTVAKEIGTSVITGQTNRQAEARFTRLSSRTQTIRGIEMGTLADLTKLRRASIPVDGWKNGVAVLLSISESIAIKRIGYTQPTQPSPLNDSRSTTRQ